MAKPDAQPLPLWMDPRRFTRRDFLKLSSLSGAALALGMITGCGNREGVINLMNHHPPQASGVGLNPFIFIDPSGKITLVSHRPDIGNGVPQAMLMLLAEEMEVDLEDIDVIQAKADESLYGFQYASSSESVRTSWLPSRRIGAAARIMLIRSAAQQWGVQEEECSAHKGYVTHQPSNRKAHYGELVAAASQLDPPEDPPLKAIEDFQIIGKSLPRKALPAKTNGSTIYGLDVRIEGMLYASIERSPVFHGKVKSYNREAVLAIPGVRHVIKSEMRVLTNIREGVAVVADSYWAALKGRKALKVEWDHGDAESWDSERIITQYREDSAKEGTNHQRVGHFDRAFARAAATLEAEYELPMMAHAAMEPLNVIADVREDSCEVWGPTQVPNWVRGDLADFLGLPLEKVQVYPTSIGGGFGRKAYTDFLNEAAYVSRKIKLPVKVVWTREDDMTQGPFRPGSINVLKAGLDSAGKLSAFSHKVVTTDYYELLGYDADYDPPVSGIATHAYEFLNRSYDSVNSSVPIPYIWMRSTWVSANGFAHECFVDEVAHASGVDPLDFRLSYLRNAPRFVAVLEKLADLTDWRQAKKPGTGRGMAILRLRDSIIGHVAEVSRDEQNRIRIDKITAVIDCGVVIHPDTVKQQVEGATIMGLSSSFKKAITLTRGRVDQQNYDTFPILRYAESPDIEVHVMSSNEDPGGVGEVGMPGAAPSVANALFDLTGTRIRKLPYDLNS